MQNTPVVGATRAPGARIVQIVCAAAGLLCCLLLALGVVGVLMRGLPVQGPGGLRAQYESNWLVTLFRLHFRAEGVQTGMLLGIRLVDVLVLSFTIILSFGLWFELKKTSRIWSLIGMAVPVIGMILFVVTHLAGRSTVMATAMVFSIIMIWSSRFGRSVAVIGILAGTLLLIGDVTESLHSMTIAMVFAIGYILLLVWYALVGLRLLRRG